MLPNTKKVLKLRAKLALDDVTVASEKQVDDFNRLEFRDKMIFKRLLCPKTKGIYTKTFIIPVNEGAVTGYLFEKIENNELVGLNPLIIYLHGGGWMLGNMDSSNAICSNICDFTGATVLSIDYRLAPKFKFPTPVEDCYSTLLWVYAGCRYWKVDPAKIYLVGDCAGANLAAVVSRLSRDRKGPPIAGQILFCPITDGRMRTASFEKYRDCPTLNEKELAYYIQNYQREPKDILDANFSPLLAKDHSRLPPTLIIAAEIDPLHDDARLYADALASADTPVKLLVSRKSIHGFNNYPKIDGWDEAMTALSAFVSGRSLANIELKSRKEQKRESKIRISPVVSEE